MLTFAMLESAIALCTISNRGGFVNNQTQHQANLMHQPTKVTQTTSIMEPSLIEPITVTVVPNRFINHCTILVLWTKPIMGDSPASDHRSEYSQDSCDQTEYHDHGAGEMPREQVSAKSKPIHGRW